MAALTQQDERRSWIVQNWPYVVERHELERLQAARPWRRRFHNPSRTSCSDCPTSASQAHARTERSLSCTALFRMSSPNDSWLSSLPACSTSRIDSRSSANSSKTQERTARPSRFSPTSAHLSINGTGCAPSWPPNASASP